MNEAIVILVGEEGEPNREVVYNKEDGMIISINGEAPAAAMSLGCLFNMHSWDYSTGKCRNCGKKL